MRSPPGIAASRADDAGVTLLAGTNSRPVRRIARRGAGARPGRVSPHVVLGAASWTAGIYLGMHGLEPGAPADAIGYDTDPREQFHTPARSAPRITLRGKVRT